MTKRYLNLAIAMTLPFFASILYFKILDGHELAPMIYLLAKVFILVFPLFFIRHLRPFRSVFRFDARELLFGTAVGAAVFLVGWLLIRIPFVLNMIDDAAPFVQSKGESFGVLQHYLLFAFVISFIHSMLEEYYWRWFVYGASGTALLSSIAFSLHHYIVLDYYFTAPLAIIFTIAVALGGMLFCWLYARKGNIWGAWGAHVGADLLIFYVGSLLLA